MDIREKILELSDEYDIHGTGDIQQHKNDLAMLIKHLPFFYDHNDPNYKSFSSRDEAWSALAEVFKTSKKDVKVQWKSLRETYRRSKYGKENKLVGLASGSQDSCVGTDQSLLEEMAYLDNFSRKMEESETADEQFSDITEAKNEIAEAMDQDTEETEPEHTENNSNLQRAAASTSSAKQTEQNSEEKYPPLTVEDLEEKYNLFPDVKDVEDLLFARFIAHELRKITCPVKRLQVQTEILRLIASYAEADSD